MPKLNPGVLDHRLNCPLTTRLFNKTLEDIKTLQEIYGQDPFKNALMYEIGVTSVLRRYGFEPKFDLIAGLHGADAQTDTLKSIEIKGSMYRLKKWKLPDIISSPSLKFGFDNRSFMLDDSRLDANDGYAFALFVGNYDFPKWVELHNYEPIILFWIHGKGVKKITNVLKQRNQEILIRMEQEAIALGMPPDRNTFKNTRIKFTFKEVFDMLTTRELCLIVNGRRLSKAQYEQALQEGDEFWLEERWKKGSPASSKHK